MRSVSVHVFCDKATVVVGQASFPEGYAYCSVYTFTSVLSARRGYFFASETSDSVGFVTFVKSNAKALLTLRIKSPLRSAEGIGWRGSLCLRSAHFGDSVLHLRLHHASMLKTFSLARMSPYTTSYNSRRHHRPHPPFSRIAIMYLWGQYPNLLSILPIDCLTHPCLKLRHNICSLIYRIENAEFVLR
jgi:hypothetical protein